MSLDYSNSHGGGYQVPGNGKDFSPVHSGTSSRQNEHTTGIFFHNFDPKRIVGGRVTFPALKQRGLFRGWTPIPPPDECTENWIRVIRGIIQRVTNPEMGKNITQSLFSDETVEKFVTWKPSGEKLCNGIAPYQRERYGCWDARCFASFFLILQFAINHELPEIGEKKFMKIYAEIVREIFNYDIGAGYIISVNCAVAGCKGSQLNSWVPRFICSLITYLNKPFITW